MYVGAVYCEMIHIDDKGTYHTSTTSVFTMTTSKEAKFPVMKKHITM